MSAASAPAPAGPFADPIEMQNRLFSELSRMFGQEVPLYDKSLAVNGVCNRAVCDLLARRYRGFAVSDEQLEKTSGERHGAIRIGRPDEYRWIGRFFACFAMQPHNFYDMTSVGAKSQPVIATAFRSVVHPEHRVFSSLLQTSYFDPETKARVEALLQTDLSQQLDLVAETEQIMAGFVLAYVPPRQPDTVFVWQIGVARDVRGRGVGLHLLRHLLALDGCRNVQYIEASITPSNTASQSLFRAFARKWGVSCRKLPFFPSEFFPEAHEPEYLYRVGPLHWPAA